MRSFVPIVLLAGLCLLMSPATVNAQAFEDESYSESISVGSYSSSGIPEQGSPFEIPTAFTPEVLPEQSTTAVECCDIAHVLNGKRNEFDFLDDRLDYLDGAIQLGLMFQMQILMRVPFTADDQQAWDDISRVILAASDEKEELQRQQNALADEIMMLNQQLSMCLPAQNNGPLVPMPDPFAMLMP